VKYVYHKNTGDHSFRFTRHEHVTKSEEYCNALHRMTISMGGPFAVVAAILKTENEWDLGSGPTPITANSFDAETLTLLWKTLLRGNGKHNQECKARAEAELGFEKENE
jgi:hypothetical protein